MQKKSLASSIFLGFSLLMEASYSQEAVNTGSEQNKETKKNNLQKSVQAIEIKAKPSEEVAHFDTTAKVVISEEALNKFGETNVVDALKQVPSLMVTNGKLHITGMNPEYTQILIDGERPLGVSIENIPMSSIARVEIYRGGSAQFSAQGIAGTINIILKKIPQTAQEQIKLRHTVAYTPNSSVEFVRSDKLDRMSYSVSLSAFKDFAGNFWENKIGTKTDIFDRKNNLIQSYIASNDRNTSDHVLIISPRLQYETEEKTKFTFNAPIRYSSESLGFQAGYKFLVGPKLPSSEILTNITSDSFSISPNLKSLIRFGESSNLDLNFGLNSSRSSQKDSIRSQNELNETNIIRNSRYDYRKNEVASSGKLTIASDTSHDLVSGWAYSSVDNTGIRNELTKNFFPVANMIDTQNISARIDSYAFFGQDEWKLSKSSSVYLGLRWESVRLKSETTSQIKFQSESSVWSPVVQGLWQLDPDNIDRLRASVARTYQAPFDSYLATPEFMSVNNSAQNPNFIGNPMLRPELAWNFDFAYEHSGKDDWNYNLRGKVQTIKDIIKATVFFRDNAWWLQMQNVNSAIAKSLEFDTQFPLSRFYVNAPQIEVNLGLSKYWSEVKGLPPPFNQFTPYNYQMSLGLDYRSKDLPISAGMSLRSQNAHWQQISLVEKSYNRVPLNLDVYALWKFNKKGQLRFAINNLTRSNNKNKVSVRDVESLQVNNIYYGQALRRFRLNLDYAF